ncbi:MAG: hypothetical protein NZ483_10540, partial [Verrucomicrobiae bacterium]|nr:hypothetical protein [Verrucomicrobiae bacterium]
MSQHDSLRPSRCVVEFRPASQATAHGGQLAVAALVTQFGLWKRVRETPALDPRTDRSKGFDPEVYVAAFLFAFTSGGVAIADGERLDADESSKMLLGVAKLPDQSALGKWLRALGEAGRDALRQITRELVAWTLARVPPERLLVNGRLECFFDDTQIEVSGKWFAGAAINYEGHWALSWQ